MSLPLYKTTHFRQLKEIISVISAYTNIDKNSYNLTGIKCYRTSGKNMLGNNVSTLSYIPFLEDETYEVYECRKIECSESERSLGDFLIFFRSTNNKSIWNLIKMTTTAEIISVNGNIEVQYSVLYDPIISGVVIKKNELSKFIKTDPVQNKTILGKLDFKFDNDEIRNKIYKFNNEKYIEKLTSLDSTREVKKYRKNNKNNVKKL